MRHLCKSIVLAVLVTLGVTSPAAAQRANSGDRALGSELNRDRAETRIERLRQDQRQNEEKQERTNSRAQKPSKPAQQQPR